MLQNNNDFLDGRTQSKNKIRLTLFFAQMNLMKKFQFKCKSVIDQSAKLIIYSQKTRFACVFHSVSINSMAPSHAIILLRKAVQNCRLRLLTVVISYCSWSWGVSVKQDASLRMEPAVPSENASYMRTYILYKNRFGICLTCFFKKGNERSIRRHSL